MHDEHQDSLDKWIQRKFEAEKVEAEHYPSFRKQFLWEVEGINRDFKIDVFVDSATLFDPENPESKTCQEVVETCTHDSFQEYLTAIREGHGTAYSEVYGRIAVGLSGPECSSEEAYRSIDNGGGDSPDNPAYIDAYDACIHQGKSREFASRCAGLVVEDGSSFPDAFKKAADSEAAYQLIRDRGHSDLWARMYTESVRTKSVNFAEIYAACVEAEIAAGRKPDEAEIFADIHASIILDYGEPDEDDPEGWRCDLWCRAKAEADYRYHRKFGDKERFIEIFDRIHQRLADSPQAGSQEWFDDIEERTKQQLAAQDAYIAAHGNLRGFKIEEEAKPPVEEALPKPPDFKRMSPEEFRAVCSGSEEDRDAWEVEAEYRTWCDDEGVDPMDSDSRNRYEEQGRDSWDDMDEHDRPGWTDNMNKD